MWNGKNYGPTCNIQKGTRGADIVDGSLSEVSIEDLSAALVDAIRSGEAKANEVVAEKYKTLEADMAGMLGGLQQ